MTESNFLDEAIGDFIVKALLVLFDAQSADLRRMKEEAVPLLAKFTNDPQCPALFATKSVSQGILHFQASHKTKLVRWRRRRCGLHVPFVRRGLVLARRCVLRCVYSQRLPTGTGPLRLFASPSYRLAWRCRRLQPLRIAPLVRPQCALAVL
jgi:hypothetical protein